MAQEERNAIPKYFLPQVPDTNGPEWEATPHRSFSGAAIDVKHSIIAGQTSAKRDKAFFQSGKTQLRHSTAIDSENLTGNETCIC